MTRRIYSLIAAVVLLSSGGGTLLAQESYPLPRVPVMVVLAEDMPYPGPAVILRRSDVSPQDVIVLRAQGANAQVLTHAVRALLAARKVAGDVPTQTVVLRARPPAGQAARELPWARRVIDDARTTEPRFILGVGRVRAVRIWLPRQQPLEL